MYIYMDIYINIHICYKIHKPNKAYLEAFKTKINLF